MRSSTNILHWLKCSACQCFKVSRLLQIRHHFCFLLPFSIGLKNACKTSRSGNFIRTTTFKDTYRTKNKRQQAEINKSRAMCRETHRAKTIMTMLMMIMKAVISLLYFIREQFKHEVTVTKGAWPYWQGPFFSSSCLQSINSGQTSEFPMSVTYETFHNCIILLRRENFSFMTHWRMFSLLNFVPKRSEK